ncbi:MAG: ATP-binding protein [Thiohalomonadaceae bacterium]
MPKGKSISWPRLPFLYFAFLLILVVMGSMVVFALERVSILNARTVLIQQSGERSQVLHRMRDAVRERFIRLNLITLSEDPFLLDELRIAFDLFASRFMVAREQIDGYSFRTSQEMALFEELRGMTTHGSPILQAVLDAALANDHTQARTLLIEQAMPVQMGVMTQMDQIFEYYDAQNSRSIAAMEQELLQTQQAIWILAFIQVLLVLLISGWVIQRTRLQHNEMRQEIRLRQRSEQALRRAKDELEQRVEERTSELNRFKSTLDRTLDCVFMFDAREMVFFYVNEGSLRQVGYSQDELLGMHAYDIKPDIDEAKFRALVAPLLSGERPSLTFETVHQHKQGQLIPVEIFLQYMAPEGEPARFVAIVRDISERKRIERMKNEFISTVSHELRTPLTSISGALGLIAGGALGELSPQAHSMIAIAYKNSQRLGYLINDLLDMEKLMAGKIRFDLCVQPLQPLLEQAIQDNRAYADQFNVRLRLSHGAGKAQVRVDAQRLHQVLTNLISNAAKFSPEDAEVVISASSDKNSVCVAVRDRGPGIPAEFHERIFQKFSQADASDTRQKGGSGLGLAISRELMERMGGRIGFDSTPGKGSIFYIELALHAGDKQG